MHIAVLIIV